MPLHRRQRRRLNGDEHSGIAASSAEHIVSESEKDLRLQMSTLLQFTPCVKDREAGASASFDVEPRIPKIKAERMTQQYIREIRGRHQYGLSETLDKAFSDKSEAVKTLALKVYQVPATTTR